MRSRQHIKPFLSYSPHLGGRVITSENAPEDPLPFEPLQSRPEPTGGRPREDSTSKNSSSDSLFFSLEEPPEPRSPSPKSLILDPISQLSSGSQTVSPPTSSQLADLRSPAKAHKDAEEAATKKARGRPKKTTTGGGTGQRGSHGSPPDGSRDR